MNEVKHITFAPTKSVKSEKNYLEKYEGTDPDIMFIQSVVATATLNKNGFFFTEDCLEKSYKTMVGKPIKAWRVGETFTTHNDRPVGYVMESHLEKATKNDPMKIVIVGAIWKSKFQTDAQLIEKKLSNGGISMSMECTYFANDEIASEEYGEKSHGASTVVFDGVQIVDDPADTLARIQRVAENEGISLEEFADSIEKIANARESVEMMKNDAMKLISEITEKIVQARECAESLKKENTLVYNKEEEINSNILANTMNKPQEKNEQASVAETVATVVQSLMQQHDLSADEVVRLIMDAIYKIEHILDANEMIAEASEVIKTLSEEKSVKPEVAESVVNQLFSAMKNGEESIKSERFSELKAEAEKLMPKTEEKKEEVKSEENKEETKAEETKEDVNAVENKEESQSNESSTEKVEEIQKSDNDNGKIVNESEVKKEESSRDELILENEKLKSELKELKAEKLHNERLAELSKIKPFVEAELEGKSKSFLAELDDKDFKIVKLERQLSTKSEAKAEANTEKKEEVVEAKVNLGEVTKETVAEKKDVATTIAKKILGLKN